MIIIVPDILEMPNAIQSPKQKSNTQINLKSKTATILIINILISARQNLLRVNFFSIYIVFEFLHLILNLINEIFTSIFFLYFREGNINIVSSPLV